MINKYLQQMVCGNCGAKYITEFEKGQSCVGLYTCKNCGCVKANAVGIPKSTREQEKGVRDILREIKNN